jgi:N,N-dimethylformamidase beta subunit-like, C-terminal/PKD domain
VVVCLGAGLLGLLVASPAQAASPAPAANPVQVENALPGDSDWQAALQDPNGANPAIQGYADATGVLPGGTISFAVSAGPGDRYRVEISRLGWYGGSGGRRITCLEGQTLDPDCDADEPATAQPAAPAPDAVTGEVQAGWSMTDTLTVPADWTSGYYLAVFRVTAGPDTGKTGFTPFIVKAPPGDHSAILVQVPTNTWEAYNTWGGEGIYTKPEAVKASFNRPYSHRLLFSWEYPLVRFLERGGWDVAYTTDDAVDADPAILLGHALDMSAGHDEYWTSAMRTGWEAARDAGVNLAFMGADDGNWQIRYEDDRRTMVAYKYLADPVTDPALTTTMFRWLNPPRPECELMGVQFAGTVVPGSYLPYTADAAVTTDPWFAGTGLTAGSVLTGLGGYEVDSITPDCHVPPVTPLFSYSGPAVQSNFDGAPTRADAARYTACSGAEVFAAGSLQFSWGLDSFRDPAYASAPAPESPALEEAMTRALADLTVSHVPRPGPPDICVPAAAFSAPSSTPGVGEAVTLASTSTDAYGQIGGQDWTLAGDGGAETVAGPALTRTFDRPGTAEVSLRVTDTSGAGATATGTIRICACPALPPSGPWPAGTELGGRCALTAFGSLHRVGTRYWFAPAPGVRRFSVATQRLVSAAGAVGAGRATRRTADAPAELPAPVRGTPLEVETTARIAGRTLLQQFLIPAQPRSGSAPRPRALTAVTCDGSSGQVLTPAFGGPRSGPLRVAVTGDGPLTVRLTGPGIRGALRRVRVSAGRTVMLSWPSTRLRGGTYSVAVSAPRSWLPQPFTLAAVRAVPPPKRARRRRQHPV